MRVGEILFSKSSISDRKNYKVGLILEIFKNSEEEITSYRILFNTGEVRRLSEITVSSLFTYLKEDERNT